MIDWRLQLWAALKFDGDKSADDVEIGFWTRRAMDAITDEWEKWIQEQRP